MIQGRPTEQAEQYFSMALQFAAGVGEKVPDDEETARQDFRTALSMLAHGLRELSIGLRATYLEIEQVKELIRRQSSQQPGKV